MSDRVATWIDALLDRHTRPFAPAEFLRAVRALSARYVEGRQALTHRSPIDSDGKRAAFAGFYAPLHFFTVQAIVGALAASTERIDTILDLGCGTGVCGAAWALSQQHEASIVGVDRLGWTLDEAAWNWRTLALHGQTRRAAMEAAVETPRAHRGPRKPLSTGVVLGWSLNELPDQPRQQLLQTLVKAPRDAVGPVLVIEPLARSAVPWWDIWADAVVGAGGRADEWKFAASLPSRLASIDEAAGFRRSVLGARTLWLPARRHQRAVDVAALSGA